MIFSVFGDGVGGLIRGLVAVGFAAWVRCSIVVPDCRLVLAATIIAVMV